MFDSNSKEDDEIEDDDENEAKMDRSEIFEAVIIFRFTIKECGSDEEEDCC